MKTRLLFLTLAATLVAGCTTPRHEALERRQDAIDARHDARMDRRELRSDRADARYGDRW